MLVCHLIQITDLNPHRSVLQKQDLPSNIWKCEHPNKSPTIVSELVLRKSYYIFTVIPKSHDPLCKDINTSQNEVMQLKSNTKFT